MARERDMEPMKRHCLLNPPKGVASLSLLAGYVAGEICSVYAIFIAHTMNPVSYHLVENNLRLRALYGRYQETYDFNGLVFTLIVSFVVFAMAWGAVRAIAWTTATSEAGFANRPPMRQLAWISEKNR